MNVLKPLKRFVNLCDVLSTPGGLRALRTWKPFSITSFRMLRALQQEGFDFGTIIDGGANVGQFARAAVETYPTAQVVAFEPLPEVFAQLKANIGDHPRVQLVHSALGDSEGTLAFHQTTYSLSSSALPLHDNHREHFPDVAPLQTIEVPVGRLDRLLQDVKLTPSVLLKLDLQGYELIALQGAKHVLDRVDYVLLETSFRPMYESEPLFEDVHAYLREVGFSFLQPLAVLHGGRGAIVQMDALFGKRELA